MTNALFQHYFISIFLVAFGVFFMLRRGVVADPARIVRPRRFDGPLRARIEAVVETRRALESASPLAWRIIGITAIALGAATWFDLVTGLVAYAVFIMLCGVSMALLFTKMRNGSDRRAAALAPRQPSVAWYWFAGAVVSACTVLPYVSTPDLRWPAVMTALAAVCVVIAAQAVSGTAAILTGSDPEIELFVDSKLRGARVMMVLFLAYALPVAFASFCSDQLAGSTVMVATARAIGAVLWFAAFAYCAILLLRKPTGLTSLG